MNVKVKMHEVNYLIAFKIGKVNIFKKAALLADIGMERIIHKSSIMDYFQYGFYYLNNAGRRNYITLGRREKIIKICNEPEAAQTFSDKAKFFRTFHDFIGRDILDMRTASYEEFEEICKKHSKLFIKPIYGSFGRDTEIVDVTSEKSIHDVYSDITGKDVLAEEVIKQHPDLEALNDTTVNSLRVVTILRKNGEAVILPGVLLRIGRKGKIADNFHNNGIVAQVNIETGIVSSTGIDKGDIRYIVHPDSGTQIVGYKVPKWEEICETAKRAAKICPNVRYVGWDVTVTEEGKIILIEGNDKADPDGGQISDGIGKWPEFKKYLDELGR